MPDIVVRKAKIDERGPYLRMWKEFLVEDLSLGGDILPNERNLKQMMGLFTAYDSHLIPGVNVSAWRGEDLVGVAMCGQTPPTDFWLESPRGVSATVWGEYVHPDYRRRGISLRMLQYIQDVMVSEMGIDYAYTTVNRNDAAEANAQSWCGDFLAKTFIYKVGQHD